LIELFDKYEEYFKTNQNIPWYSFIKNYISQKNTNEILSGTINMLEAIPLIQDIPIIGKLGRPLKTLLDIDKNFQEVKVTYEEGEKGLVKNYLSANESKDITETDIISQLIKDKIQEIKGSKKSVLIIDDLDRLDPEHIFRILNILSAHFDQGKEQEGDNKFGFDYIIIVGDYHNIQSIFHHKYGKKADFDGYIDKFYTVKPFEFDNRKVLLANLGDLLKKYQREDSPKNNLDYSYFIIQDIIRKTISLDIINLRKLLKHTKIKLVPVKDKISNIPIDSSYLFTTVDILIDMFETKDSLISRIQKIKDSNIYDGFEFEAELYKYRSIIRELYIIIHPNKINPKQASPSQYAEYGKYMLVFEGSHYGETVTIKQQSLDQNYKNLYYDLLIDFINNKFDEIKK
jgi:hypothetical protein